MESGLKTLTPSNPDKLAKRTSPWGTPVPPQAPFSLAAVMDEELAKKLQKEEEKSSDRAKVEGVLVPSLLKACPGPEDTRDDFLVAQMLQLEYDKEHDLQLRAEEKHFNKHSTVHVSYEKYRSLHPYLEEEQQASDDSYDEGDDPIESAPKSHRRSKGVSIGVVTKHDAVLCGRKNVKNMEKFPPDFPAGDLNEKGQDYRLSNAVFNTLKHHSQKEEKYAQKLHEKKEHSTHEQVLDQKTRLMLFKMVDSGLLTEVNGCISTGKESRIYHAQGGESEEYTVPAECAVKIFKTTLNEFKNRDRYIKADYRFKGRFGKSSRKLVKLWAEKEMHNLKRLSAGGIRCPEVVVLKKHVLVMSFVGEDMKPAPQLREVKFTPSQLESAYQQCTKGMRRMYQECHLIHADLSEYNMLWFKGHIYFIDVGQSVEPSHPNGLEFLFRDCSNVSLFFSRRAGLGDNAMTSQQLFNYITDLGIHADSDREFIVQLQNHQQREKANGSIHSKTDYAFDYFFEKTSAEGGESHCDTVEDPTSDSAQLDSSSSRSDSEHEADETAQ